MRCNYTITINGNERTNSKREFRLKSTEGKMYTQVNTEKAPSISNDDSTNYIIYRTKKNIPILQITLGNSNPNLLCHVTNWCVTGCNKTLVYNIRAISTTEKRHPGPTHMNIANTPEYLLSDYITFYMRCRVLFH